MIILWIIIGILALAFIELQSGFPGPFWLIEEITKKTFQNSNDTSDKTQTHSKIGPQGKAKTPLKPGGKVIIDGVIYDAISTGQYIDKGSRVRVIGVEMNVLKVTLHDTASS